MNFFKKCYFRNVTREFMVTRLHHQKLPRNIQTIFEVFIFFSEPNNYCFDRAAPGQLYRANVIREIL